MISRQTVICLGLSQLINWGISYYLIGNFGPAMADDLGMGTTAIYAGLSLALVVMAATSPWTGRLIDRLGGRRVLPVGAVLNALGCVVLAVSQSAWTYYAAWIFLGIGMRLCLYEAAFATLARIGGVQARRAIGQITLFGGLASTVMWPVGHALAGAMGWRGALLVYAVFSLATLPLYRGLPPDRRVTVTASAAALPTWLARTPAQYRQAAILFSVIAMLTSFLAAGNAAHMLNILGGMGLDPALAVGIAALWGIGQVLARLGEFLFGQRIDPLKLNLLIACLLPLCFLAGLAASVPVAAAIFSFCYGACNGLFTISKGTLPLVLFDHRRYGALTGRLLVPSFLLTATAPLLYAAIITNVGAKAAMGMALAVACVVLGASAWLVWMFRHRA
ncbi:MFS transporter [Pigmentiphaga aceris]|uniref:MFS transporter n=1 Tax=Pigmentiphaga aceris TaxID=1940612 RepID=A0A5C0AW92_9BURK|nr:MFS transporter [Pigmentiphaga aceris]QEI06578.1 MFS transporter [Pigmentiphaga aceris]